MRKIIIFPIIILALLLVSCGPSVSDAKTDFCDNLAKLGQAIQTVRDIDADSTLEQVKDAQKQLEEAMAGTRESGGVLKEVQLKATEAAFDEVTKVIEGISDEATLKEAVEAIQKAVTKFDAAFQVINTTICGGK